MKKLLKLLFKALFIICISVLVGTNLFVINAKLLGDPLPMPFGYGSAIVLSGSMEPTLSVDDLVVVQETNDYEVGDVVVYQQGGILIVHTIIKTDGENYLTQGDANNAPDDPISIDQIRGEVITSIKCFGPIVRFLQSPMGILVVFIAGFVGLEISYLIRKIRYNKDMKAMEAEKIMLNKKK